MRDNVLGAAEYVALGHLLGRYLVHLRYVSKEPCISGKRDLLMSKRALTTQHFGISSVWIWGDFNLRGIAPGPSMGPAVGSGHESIAEDFKSFLSIHGLAALSSGPTHRRGGALDIHITNVSGCDEVATVVRVATELGCRIVLRDVGWVGG